MPQSKRNTWTNENLKELYYTTGDLGYEKASQIFGIKKKSISAVFYRHNLIDILRKLQDKAAENVFSGITSVYASYE